MSGASTLLFKLGELSKGTGGSAVVNVTWVINGVKTWCTFGARANVLMLLARTDPDRSKTHRGLSLFIVPKPRGEGHGFEFTQEGTGGKMEGRAIDTIGYRGMHSYEIAIENWWVPETNLIGGRDGLGRGIGADVECGDRRTIGGQLHGGGGIVDRIQRPGEDARLLAGGDIDDGQAAVAQAEPGLQVQ